MQESICTQMDGHMHAHKRSSFIYDNAVKEGEDKKWFAHACSNNVNSNNTAIH